MTYFFLFWDIPQGYTDRFVRLYINYLGISFRSNDGQVILHYFHITHVEFLITTFTSCIKTAHTGIVFQFHLISSASFKLRRRYP